MKNIPRKEGTWVMSSHGGGSFTGNAKYMFLHISNDTDDKATYLINDEEVLRELKENGYSAIAKDSIKAKWKTARAENVCITHGSGDIPWWYAGGANILNLWHGVPIKKIGFEPGAKSLKQKQLYKDMVIITPDGDLSEQRFKNAFHIDSSQIARTGYPRNEAIISEFEDSHLGSNKQSLCEISEFVREYDETYIYLPTFRESNSPIESLPTPQLNRYLEGRDAGLVVKGHPKDSGRIDSNYSNILQVDERIDIYQLLSEFDLLITDYSSVYFDYMVIKSPIVFFWYDLEEYKSQWGFFDDFESITPGMKSHDQDMLIKSIQTSLNKDPCRSEREIVYCQVGPQPDGSCRRIYNIVK
jgi:CDP-glycerol glycerophosphotransferase (TagB/SpsB family)